MDEDQLHLACYWALLNRSIVRWNASLSDAASRRAFLNCCTEEQTAWAIERVGTQPLAPFLGPVEIPDGALDGMRRAYVLCTQDHAIPPALQRRMIAEHGVTDVVELDTDHAPFLSTTAELVAALDGFVRSTP